MISVYTGRGDGIRTHGLFVPNEALYQTEPHLDISLGMTTKLPSLSGRGRRIRTLGTRFWSYGFRIEPRFRSFCFMLFCVEKSLYIAIFRSSFMSSMSFHLPSYRFISTNFQNFGSHLVLILKSSTRGFKPQLFINTRFFRSLAVRIM